MKRLSGSKRVLFVCAGNTCRSPMAEAIARQILGTTADVQSAGICADEGASATQDAIAVMEKRGLDIRNHSARGIGVVDTSEFDLIVAMDSRIARSIRSRGVDTTIILELDIPDPYGQGIECYRITADAIVRELQRILTRG